MQEPSAKLQCQTCYAYLKHGKTLTQHKCPISICMMGDKPDMEVRSNPEVLRLLGPFPGSRHSVHQLLKFTYITGTALAGLAPLFFPTRHTPPILSQLGCVEDSYALLRNAAQESPVKLLKKLKIKMNDKILDITKNLIPNSSYELKRKKLKIVDKIDHVMVYYLPGDGGNSGGQPRVGGDDQVGSTGEDHDRVGGQQEGEVSCQLGREHSGSGEQGERLDRGAQQGRDGGQQCGKGGAQVSGVGQTDNRAQLNGEGGHQPDRRAQFRGGGQSDSRAHVSVGGGGQPDSRAQLSGEGGPQSDGEGVDQSDGEGVDQYDGEGGDQSDVEGGDQSDGEDGGQPDAGNGVHLDEGGGGQPDGADGIHSDRWDGGNSGQDGGPPGGGGDGRHDVGNGPPDGGHGSPGGCSTGPPGVGGVGPPDGGGGGGPPDGGGGGSPSGGGGGPPGGGGGGGPPGGGGDGGHRGRGSPFQNQLNNHNRFRNPQLWTNEELRVLIGIFRQEFVEFCVFTRPATQHRRSSLTHESHTFLFLFRYVQDASCEVLGALFGISADSAMRYYDDVLYFLIYHDPYIPRIWNDATASIQDIESLLRDVQQRQSPGIRYLSWQNLSSGK